MLIIQEATIEDVQSIARINYEAWQKAYKGIAPESFLNQMRLEGRVELFSRALSDDPCLTYVGINNDKIVGFINFGKAREDDIPKTTAEIWGIYIDIDSWGKGYGTSLCDFAFQCMSKEGFDSSILWAFDQNDRAERFYLKLGFNRDGTERKEPHLGSASIVRYYKQL